MICFKLDFYTMYSEDTKYFHIQVGASLVLHTIKNPPAMQETSLEWDDPLEEEMATHFSNLA